LISAPESANHADEHRFSFNQLRAIPKMYGIIEQTHILIFQ